MTRFIARTFFAHPQSVDESYLQHMRFAGWFALRLLLASAAAAIHAVVPCLFEKTAGRMIGEMNDKLASRH